MIDIENIKKSIKKIEVEKKWSWEDEKLMEAYACKKYILCFGQNKSYGFIDLTLFT